MPDQEEKVRIVISGEDDDASKTISKVSKALGGLDKPVSGMTSKLNTLGGTLAKLGGIAVGGGIVALGGALAVAAVKGVQFNASMEQTTVAFTTLLKSGDAATKMLEDLQQFAAATPFEFPQLASAAQNLLAMGFAADDLIPIMTDVGNTVSALGGGAPEIDRVVTALGQMSAKGKASAEDLGQLAELGIPIWQQLADKLGVTTAAHAQTRNLSHRPPPARRL